MDKLTDQEFWIQLAESLKGLGPIIGIGLPMIEAIFPFLPLIVFATINVTLFGLVLGYIYTLIGQIIGSILFYLVFLKLVPHKKTHAYFEKHEKFNKIKKWLESNSFFNLVILYTFPFMPSSLITIVAALSDVTFKRFAISLTIGKIVNIFLIIYIGDSIKDFFTNPSKTIIALSIVFILGLISKKIGKKMEEIQEKENEI